MDGWPPSHAMCLLFGAMRLFPHPTAFFEAIRSGHLVGIATTSGLDLPAGEFARLRLRTCAQTFAGSR